MANHQESAFQAAIHLVKDTTESLVTKVEEAAVSAMVSSILGTDERIETQREVLQESKAETGKATQELEVPRDREREIEKLKGDVNYWKQKYSTSEEEVASYQERLSVLSHKMAAKQQEASDEVEKAMQQVHRLQSKLEEEKHIYGREIIGLTEQVIQERMKSTKEKESMEVEWKSLRAQIKKWEEIVTDRELENFQLRKRLHEREKEIEKLEGLLKSIEEGKKEEEKTEEEKREEERREEEQKIEQTPRGFEELKLPGLCQYEEKKAGIQGEFSQKLEPVEEFEEISLGEAPKRPEYVQGEILEQVKEVKEEQKEVQKEEKKEEGEHLLSQEEIKERLKQKRHIAIPAVRAGGRRIKQNPSGPHLINHKPTLVEKRDERIQAENMETAESTSRHLMREEQKLELMAKADEMRRKIQFQPPEAKKAFYPSTYHPPMRTHDENLKLIQGGLHQYQPPMHGHSF